jgi:hypothetical protein
LLVGGGRRPYCAFTIMERCELYGYITESGVLHIQNRKRLEQWAAAYPGKQVVIKIERRGVKRSNQQSRYYWGVVVESVRHGLINLGHELNKDEVHFFLKERFNQVTIENKRGECIDIAGSTTQMTKSEFSDYIEKIARFSADFLGIIIPAPNEELTLKLD